MTNKEKKAFLTAIPELAEQKGISEEKVIDILKESFCLAYAKKIENEYQVFSNTYAKKNKEDSIKLTPAMVRCEIDMKKGDIKLFRQWTVRNDDDIVDDFIEIAIEDEKVVEAGLKVGDIYEEEFDINNFDYQDALKAVTNFRQKISRAEKESLVEAYKGKVGELVTGVVQKVDPHSIIVELDRYQATLFEREWIGKESFRVGEQIKVFIKGIGKDSRDSKNGSLIQISRACEGFLARLFKNEIHEIYDGTVEIKDIARIAGIRSKVAVYSSDPNVDPCGACIGPSGSRIQAIVSQLGKPSGDTLEREKIDIITYHENLGLYLAEALKPGVVKGAVISPDTSSAIAICEDGTEKFAIGKGYQNINLAKKLLKLKEITVKTETEAVDEGILYTTIEIFEAEEKEAEKRKNREKALALQKLKIKEEKEAEATKVDFLSKDEDIDEIEDLDTTFEAVTAQVSENKEVEPVEEKVETPVETVEAAPIVEEKVEEKVETPVETVEVNTTISLNDLEAILEQEKKTKQAEQGSNKKKNKKDENKSENKVDVKKPLKKMDIYTEEELREFESEDDFDNDYYSDEDDFSEYDDDDYYEDK